MLSVTEQRRPAGLRRLTPLPFVIRFRRDPLAFAMQLREQYGDIAVLRMGLRSSFFFFHPDDAQHILQTYQKNYAKGRATAKVRPFFGAGLFSSEGPSWNNQRKLLRAAFARQRLATYASEMVECANAVLDEWHAQASTGTAVNLVSSMKKFTLTAVTRTLFGTDPGARIDELERTFVQVLAYLNHRTTSPLPLPVVVPTTQNRGFRRAYRLLSAFVDEMVRARRSREGAPEDMLSILLGARDDSTGEPLSADRIRDEILTFMMAGHETTAATLAWALYSVATNAAVEDALLAEIAPVLAGAPPDAQGISRLELAGRIIDETLRMYPPAPFISRQALVDDEISGCTVRRGSTVTVSPYVTHRHPAFWAEPDRFDPDRFLPDRSANRPRYAYLPFGGGPRICIGNEFALLEERIFLALAFRRYRLVPIAGGAPPPGGHTVRAPNGLWARPEPR